jgi:hypothetical protein
MVTALAGALALCIAVPAVASARVAWHANYQPVTSAVATEWSGKIKLTSTGVPRGSGVECTDTVTGTATSGGAGEVTKVTTSGCKGTGGLCQLTEKNSAITALNLPWRTELESVEGVLRNVLVSSGKGTPGLKLECEAGVKDVEECAGTLGTSMTNTESGVSGAFISTEKLTCDYEGKAVGTGTVTGSQSISNKSQILSAMLEEPVPSWEANKKPVEENRASTWSKGSLTMYVDTNVGELGVTCEDSGAGQVGKSGTGSITSMTFSKCGQAVSSECRADYALEANNLPWTTGLIIGFGNKDIENWITAGSSGKPTFTLKCEPKGKGVVVEERCEASGGGLAANMTNTTESGVLAEFRRTEAFNCKGTDYTTYGGEIEAGSQTINLTGGETLRVT